METKRGFKRIEGLPDGYERLMRVKDGVIAIGSSVPPVIIRNGVPEPLLSHAVLAAEAKRQRRRERNLRVVHGR